MFICSGRNWYAGTEQRSSGTFLLLCQPKTPAELITWECPWTVYEKKDGKNFPPGRKCGTKMKAPSHEPDHVKCSSCGRESIAPIWIAPFTDIRCLVKHVQLHQCGHWMMGDMTVHGEKISLSGAYGSDGLPTEVKRETWEKALPLPLHLIEALKTGGGHNGVGTEGMAIREWANENLSLLRKASRKSNRVSDRVSTSS
jgi:hypothetical protein